MEDTCHNSQNSLHSDMMAKWTMLPFIQRVKQNIQNPIDVLVDIHGGPQDTKTSPTSHTAVSIVPVGEAMLNITRQPHMERISRHGPSEPARNGNHDFCTSHLATLLLSIAPSHHFEALVQHLFLPRICYPAYLELPAHPMRNRNDGR